MKILHAMMSAVLGLSVLGFTAPADPIADAKKMASALLPGANDWNCRPSAEHPRPVVLVHGTFGSGGVNYSSFAPTLAMRGFCVFALDHGTVPGVPALAGLAPAETSAEQLATFVKGVLQATGAKEVDLVAYSFGGLVARYYMRFFGGAEHVRAYVGIGGSQHGTTPQGVLQLASGFAGALAFLPKCGSCTDQMAGSEPLTRLAEGGDEEPGVEITVIASKFDEVVQPYETQFMKGARNVLLQDLCSVAYTEHIGLTSSAYVIHETLNVLDPTRTQRTGCFTYP